MRLQDYSSFFPPEEFGAMTAAYVPLGNTCGPTGLLSLPIRFRS